MKYKHPSERENEMLLYFISTNYTELTLPSDARCGLLRHLGDFLFRCLFRFRCGDRLFRCLQCPLLFLCGPETLIIVEMIISNIIVAQYRVIC